MKIIIFTKKIWNKNNYNNYFKNKIKIKFSQKLLNNVNPKKIFFIHWSKIIPKKIFNKFECIQFHCSDLPKFRGGSPVQNQILKGIKKTKLSAFRVGEKIDSGPVYLKKNISLAGNASKIYKNIEKTSLKMIDIIIKKKIKPKKQIGKNSFFKRRKISESRMPLKIKKLSKIYDFIRMLDADGYPRANIKIGNFYCEFYDTELKKNKLNGKFTIKK